MNRCIWPLATAFTVLLTVLVVTQTGLPATHRLAHHWPRHIELHKTATDPWTTNAANRYRTCAPTHWRDCMIQH